MVSQLYIIPNWFVWYSIILESIFAIITLGVAFHAFKINKYFKQSSYKIFGIGFLFIALSYIIMPLLNLFIIIPFNEGESMLRIRDVGIISSLGIYAYLISFVIGLVMILCAIQNLKDKYVFFAMLALSLACLVGNEHVGMSFYLVTSIIIFFLCAHALANALKTKKTNAIKVFIAFSLFLIGNSLFMFAHASYKYYILGHFFELGAYLVLLITLISLRNHGKKKK